MNTKQKIKSILWGTLIVSVVPPFFMFVKNGFLGISIDEAGYSLARFGWSTVFSIVVTLSIFISNYFIFEKLTPTFNKNLNDAKRIISCLVCSLIASNLIMYLEWQAFNVTVFKISGAEERNSIFENQLLATVLVIIVSLVYEIKYYLDKLKSSIKENERLERAYLKAQLEGIKTQVSPHFLFNSFNALQSLIEDNPENAKKFVNELATVYRYVLDKRDDMVVTLEEEINFIHSYTYLNKIRFGNNLDISLSVHVDKTANYLPPLTLQLLVENAIKHNIVSQAKPLNINIKFEAGQLVVENAFQPRNEKIQSTHIGQKNLIDRYQLLTDLKPIFQIINGQYVAQIPLIQSTNLLL